VPCAAGAGGTPTVGETGPPARQRSAEYGRRATAKCRRTIRHLSCRYLWTLTYRAEPPDRRAAVDDLRAFFRWLNRAQPGCPIVAVMELGGANGRVHWHFVTPWFLDVDQVRAAWGKGRVHVGAHQRMRGAQAPKKLGRYLAKYIAKAFDDELDRPEYARAAGDHRYLVSQGSPPPCWSFAFHHAAYAWARVDVLMPPNPEWGSFGDEPGSIVWGWWLSWPDD
jgi:hypothetical protein